MSNESTSTVKQKKAKLGLENKIPDCLWLFYHNKLQRCAASQSNPHTIIQMHPHNSNSNIRAHSTKWIINKSSQCYSRNEGLQSKHALLLTEILNCIQNIAHSFSENIAHSFSSVPHKVKTHLVYHFLWRCSGVFCMVKCSSVVLPCHLPKP